VAKITKNNQNGNTQ